MSEVELVIVAQPVCGGDVQELTQIGTTHRLSGAGTNILFP